MDNNMKSLFRKKFSAISIVLFAALICMAILAVAVPKKAVAAGLIGDTAPLAGSGLIFGNNTTTTQPWFAVGTGQFNGGQSYAKIYVPNGVSASLTVQQGGGVCGIDVGNPVVDYTVYALDNNEQWAAGGGLVDAKRSSNFGCGSFTMKLTGGVQSNVIGHSGFTVYYFQAIIAPGIGDNEKNFRLHTSSGYVGVAAPAIAYASPWFGIYQRDAPGYTGISGSSCSESSYTNQNPAGCNWNWSVNYGPHCDEDTSTTNRTAQLYDVDWQIYAQPFLRASVRQDSRTDTGINWVGATPGAPNPVSRYQDQFASGSHTNNPLSWASNVNYRYSLLFQDIDFHNTIQIALPYDQFDGSDAVKCPVPAPQCLNIASTNGTSLALNQGTNINFTLKNNSTGGISFPGTWEMRQVLPNGNTVFPLGSALAAGSSKPIGPFVIAGRSSPVSLTFTYALFDGSGSGANVVGSNPLCKITLSWGGAPPAPGVSMTAACGQTTVSIGQINDNWHPPLGAAPTSPPRRLDGLIVDKVPAQVIITSDTGDRWVYNVGGPNSVGGLNNNGTTTIPTYQMADQSGNVMWAHKSYHLELLIQGDSTPRDSFTYNNDGAWATSTGATYYGAPISVAQADTPTDCMDASCGGATVPDGEPGQRQTFQMGFNVRNKTTHSYNSNDANYHFTVSTSGGLVDAQNVQVIPGSIDPSGAVDDTITVQFTARDDFTGSFSVTFWFAGSPIVLNSLPGSSCSSPDVTFRARPFFEVRAGDISTGGGFTSKRNGSNSCADTASGDSPYISPAVTGYHYSGDIRAFSRPNQAIGSLSQFGAYQLGLTIGSIGGPIGFYSADNATFANASSPTFSSIDSQGYSGYLNSSPPAHCTPVDFFNATRTTTTGFSGSLSSSPSGQYTTLGTSIGNETIAAGKQITLYVDGDLNITGDIKYASDWDPNDQSSVPYLTVIVKGNITLSDNVRQLDGLYIAQPDGTSGGHFDTCDPTLYCPSSLVVNGAIIAQQVDLLRTAGSMGPCEAASPTCSLIGNGPAEVINYVPSMVIGMPNLLQDNAGAIIPTGVEGIFNLPPVF
jgi:hypothetical protein